jgi:hypothetical protein
MKVQRKFLKADIKRLKELRARSRRSEVIIGARLIKLKETGKITQEQFNEVMGISNPQER